MGRIAAPAGHPLRPQWLRDAAAVSPGASSSVPRVPARLLGVMTQGHLLFALATIG